MAALPVRFEKDADSVVTITFDAPGAPVNTMTAEWQAAFTGAVAEARCRFPAGTARQVRHLSHGPVAQSAVKLPRPVRSSYSA